MKNKHVTSNPYLAVGLGGELFAIDFSKVITIINGKGTRKLPFAHKYVVGKMDFNGYDLPIVDLRKKLKIQPADNNKDLGILVLKLNGEQGQYAVGIIVDFITNIGDFSNSETYPAPESGSLYTSGMVKGMAKHMKKYYLLLNVDNILTPSDVYFFNKMITYKELSYVY